MWGSRSGLKAVRPALGRKKRIAIGGDHWGYQLKGPLKEHLEGLGHEVVDVGAHEHDPADDYPDFAKAVAERVARGEADRGVVVCGSGVGACVAANKVLGVRASVCHDAYSAHQGVEHDDMNVLCLGSRIVGDELARELVTVFVSAEFTAEERHRRRLDKVRAMEARWSEDARS
jgi:ribose 5-phosphate isomerase B